MLAKNRQKLLQLVALAIVGLFVIDQVIVTWAVESWSERSKRIETLRKNVDEGKKLMAQGAKIRSRWDEMQRTDLPEDEKRADNEVVNAMNRWRRDSRTAYTGYTAPRWVTHEEEGYEILECGLAAVSDQPSLAHLIYELESDNLATRVTKLEFTARDAEGKQVELNLRFNFLRIVEPKKNTR